MTILRIYKGSKEFHRYIIFQLGWVDQLSNGIYSIGTAVNKT